MKQQIIVSGIGGQGALFLTRIIAQAAVDLQIPVLTSETHGMAQRGGTVISTIKTGGFASALIRNACADVGFILWEENLGVHSSLMKGEGKLFINSPDEVTGQRIDASSIARELGNPVLSNLVLLGMAASSGALFCDVQACEESIRRLAPAKYADQNLQAFYRGMKR